MADDDANAGAYKVPLEPYPAPPFQAIDQQGYEYPPRVVPPAQTFEAMVQQLDLMHQASKRRRRLSSSRRLPEAGAGRGGSGGSRVSEEAEEQLATAVQSVEEAIRDLLIVADLIHVVRNEGSNSSSSGTSTSTGVGKKGAAAAPAPAPTAGFIGQDSLTDVASLAARGVGVPHRQGKIAPIPVAHMPAEVVLEMKKRGLREAAADMAQWVGRTAAALGHGRRLLADVVGLRRCSRLRAGNRNAALHRPLSVADTLSVAFDTKAGPLVLPFETEEDGAPRVPGLGRGEEQEEEGNDAAAGGASAAAAAAAAAAAYLPLLRVSVIDGVQRAAATVGVGRPPPAAAAAAGRQEEGAGAGAGKLAAAVRALEDEAALGKLFDALRREAANPALPWVDRHGLATINGPLRPSRQRQQQHEEEEGVHVSGPLPVVTCRGGAVAVEADHVHALQVQFGGGGGIEPTEGPDAATAARLRRLSRLALVRLVELGRQDPPPPDMLARVAALVAHRQYMDRLVPLLTRAAARSRGEGGEGGGGKTWRCVVEEMHWVDFPCAAPRSTIVVAGRTRARGEGDASSTFSLEVSVAVTTPALLWTWCLRGGEDAATVRVTELGRVKEVARYIERVLAVGR